MLIFSHTPPPPPHTHILSAIALLLALLFLSYLVQPVGLLLALVVAWGLFFLPLSFHRIPHVSGWQNPTSMAGLVIGFSFTSLCYVSTVVPNILIYLNSVHHIRLVLIHLPHVANASPCHSHLMIFLCLASLSALALSSMQQ